MTYTGVAPYTYTEDIYDYKRKIIWFSDFVGGDGVAPFSKFGNGVVANTTTGQSNKRLGVTYLAAGAGTTDNSKVGAPTIEQISVGYSALATIYEACIYLEDTGTVTDNFVCRAGCFMSDTATEGTNGIFFRYNYAQANGWWQCVTRSSGSETITAGKLVLEDTFYSLRFEVNPTATAVNFMIDGVLVATHTTNIPKGPTTYIGGPGVLLAKSAGTATRYLNIDYLYFQWGLPQYRI